MRITAILSLFLLSFGLAYAAEPMDLTSATVKQTITKFMEDNHIPGVAVEMYVDGKPYSYYFGTANAKKNTPISKNTIFEIGSITKLMTSLLLAQEIDVAKMNLHDSVRKYNEALPESFTNITLLNLATHTSGLPFKTPENIKTTTDLTSYFSEWQPQTAPSDQYIYSNVGIGMLGNILETETHQDYSKLLQAHITHPLKMQTTGITVAKRYQKFYAQGYDVDGKPVAPIKMSIFPTAAALKASANDMQRFLSAAIGLPGTPERILYPMRMTETAYMKLPENLQGLAWLIHPLTKESVEDLLDEPDEMNRGPSKVEEVYSKPKYNGDALIDKTGGTDGFRTYVALIPNKKSGIVILTNKFVSNGEIVNAGREILFKVTKLSDVD